VTTVASAKTAIESAFCPASGLGTVKNEGLVFASRFGRYPGLLRDKPWLELNTRVIQQVALSSYGLGIENEGWFLLAFGR